MMHKGIFKTFKEFPYDFFQSHFEDLWEFKEIDSGRKNSISSEAQKRLEVKSSDLTGLTELIEKLFPVGSRISSLAAGRILEGTVAKICKEGDSFKIGEREYSNHYGDILFNDDKGYLRCINILSILEEFYWREMFPAESKKAS